MFGTIMDNNRLPPASSEPPIPEVDDTTLPLTSLLPSPSVSPPPADSVALSPAREVFSAPDRFFAIGRWLIYLVMWIITVTIERWLLVSLRPQFGALWWHVVVEGSMALAALLPGFAMARIEGRTFASFGLPLRRAFGRNFLVGAAWGIASLSVLMLALRVAGVFYFGTLYLHGPRIGKFALYYAVFFLLTGLFEEFLLRGYSQWVLTKAAGFWPAAVFLSCLFGFIHGSNPGEAKTGLVAAGFIGFFLCLTLRRTGDLWWAVGFHMAWDWGESYLYSVPDSGALLPGHLLDSQLSGPDWLAGGSVGPEGSYLVFVVIAAVWFIFDRVYPQVKYGVGRP
jgi:uncharacterized protein